MIRREREDKKRELVRGEIKKGRLQERCLAEKILAIRRATLDERDVFGVSDKFENACVINRVGKIASPLIL